MAAFYKGTTMTKTTFKKLILDDLKKQGRGDIAVKITSIKHKVYSGGDSVTVHANDLGKEQREYLETLLDQYQDGHFDSMQDMYVYSKNQNKPRTAKYVSLTHEFTPAVKDKLTAMLKNEYAGLDSDQECKQAHGQYLDAFLFRKLNEFENEQVQSCSV